MNQPSAGATRPATISAGTSQEVSATTASTAQGRVRRQITGTAWAEATRISKGTGAPARSGSSSEISSAPTGANSTIRNTTTSITCSAPGSRRRRGTGGGALVTGSTARTRQPPP